MADDSSDPDKVYSSSLLSRRAALAVGGTGLTAALAGCSQMLDSSAEASNTTTESQNGSDGENGGEGESDRQVLRTTRERRLKGVFDGRIFICV